MDFFPSIQNVALLVVIILRLETVRESVFDVIHQIANNNKKANIFLYKDASISKRPPNSENGMEVMAKAKNRFLLKKPSL